MEASAKKRSPNIEPDTVILAIRTLNKGSLTVGNPYEFRTLLVFHGKDFLTVACELQALAKGGPF